MIHSDELFVFTFICSVHKYISYFFYFFFGSDVQHTFHSGGQFLENLFFPAPPWHFAPQNFFSFLHLQVLEIKQSFVHWQWLSFPPEALNASPACVSDIILCLILSLLIPTDWASNCRHGHIWFIPYVPCRTASGEHSL